MIFALQILIIIHVFFCTEIPFYIASCPDNPAGDDRSPGLTTGFSSLPASCLLLGAFASGLSSCTRDLYVTIPLRAASNRSR